jgi:hypothetical protein
VSDNQDKIVEGVQPFLEAGETVRAALNAQPRGQTTAVATGGIARMIGQAKTGRVHRAAGEAGIEVAAPMGVVLTDRRLLTLAITTSMARGKVTGVKEVMSSIPLSEVESIERKRVGFAGVLVRTARGSEVQREAPKVGPVKELAEAFAGTPRMPA